MAKWAAGLACAMTLVGAASASAAVDIVGRGFTPDPATVGGTANLDIEVKVGTAPYIVEFFCCDVFDTTTAAGTIDDSNPATQGLSGRHRFTFNAGTADAGAERRTVTVRVTDSNGDQARQTFTFRPPVIPDPGPQTIGACQPTVSFGLILARSTNGGCWVKRRAGRTPYTDSGVTVVPDGVFYENTGRFTLNGIPFPAAPSGKKYVLAEPSNTAPGGQLGLDSTVELKLGTTTVFRQPVLWRLPTGTTEGQLAAFNIPVGQSLAGLQFGGQISVIFRKRNGSFGTSFPINVTLPSIFKPSPGTTGAITGATEIRTDDRTGVSLDGGKIEVENAAIGKLAVKQLCFSYLSANVSSRFAACSPPTLDGAPAVPCAPPTRAQERFDGALNIQLPTGRQTQFAAYGGIAGGEFAYGGGFVDNAGIPLVQGITLERIGFGLCVKPSLAIRGDVGFGAAGRLVRGNVGLTYGEPSAGSFFVELSGGLSVADIPVGNGRVRVDSTGTVDFNLAASMLLAGGFVQINGGVAGFIRPNPFAFNVDGRIALCLDLSILGKPCATGTATVSNLGAGGCADFSFIGKFSGFFFWKQPARGKRFDYGSGCGFQNRVRVARNRQAGGPATFPVPPGSPQYVAHIKGGAAAPKVRITSPSGKVLVSGDGPTTSDLQSFLIVENPTANETSVFLQQEAAPGDWKVEPLPGSTVTGIEFQGEEKTPTVLAGRLSGAPARRTVDLTYALRPGDRVSLDVIGKDFQQSIATGLTGKKCPAGRTAPGRTASQSRCARVSWTPKFGFAGERTVQATVLDSSGAAIDEQVVGRFVQGPPKLPPFVPQLRLVRSGTDVFAIWGRSGGTTARYGAYAELTDGRRIGHASPKECLAWRIRKVSPRTGVTLRLQAGRQDLRFGSARSVRLLPGKAYAGPPQLRRATVPRPCESI